jgi:hypothetical protein
MLKAKEGDKKNGGASDQLRKEKIASPFDDSSKTCRRLAYAAALPLWIPRRVNLNDQLRLARFEVVPENGASGLLKLWLSVRFVCDFTALAPLREEKLWPASLETAGISGDSINDRGLVKSALYPAPITHPF